MIVEIILIKSGLFKLGIQIEESIKKAKTDKVKAERKESLNAIKGALELINGLSDSLSRSNTKCDELEAYIEDINKDKFKQK